MISEHLDLKAGSLVAAVLNRKDQSEETREKFYGTITKTIADKFYPRIQQFLDTQGFLKMVDDCKTVEEIEALRCDLLYPTLFEDIAQELDENSHVTDLERIFLFSRIIEALTKSVYHWFEKSCYQRMERIRIQEMQKPKGRIIT